MSRYEHIVFASDDPPVTTAGRVGTWLGLPARQNSDGEWFVADGTVTAWLDGPDDFDGDLAGFNYDLYVRADDDSVAVQVAAATALARRLHEASGQRVALALDDFNHDPEYLG